MTAETLAEPTATTAPAVVAEVTPAATAPATEPSAAVVAPPPAEPVEYAFTTPDGAAPLDPKRVEAFTALAKELKLPADTAQKVVDLAAQEAKASAEAHTALVQSWADEVKADKTLGGDNLSASALVARKAIDLGPPELKELLNSTGLGNHPAVFKWAYAVGKALSEDTFRTSGTASNSDNGSIATRLYGAKIA